MTWIFDDDHCWCGDSESCHHTDCFRHMSNRKPQSAPDIFTAAMLKGTPDCVYYKEDKNESE